ncbi:hypothetical protein T4B_6452 [Trichinella pseudospiralis]|uniref:Uncharacterized protein n=2 Tax=Trichinella pseudospiralis TaxID=6337 RepID=A0A0V0Y8G0_TRIPS|nr:hypothetical protein T4E_12181 [Trichinella pseudospiralis]KRY65805.1 hypothetical protein T4A_11614 [Trichinella pseudospiralis]KRY86104.1 hypothetical protein T4D_14255 [Trichinella pseudospiralis]KRZ19543.1 hypothetical protein T4B_6452 [Trichinella pseudospiralis]KRZ41903.1 hypothetical protein T4C_411 [Trichinella pseudospiralis]
MRSNWKRKLLALLTNRDVWYTPHAYLYRMSSLVKGSSEPEIHSQAVLYAWLIQRVDYDALMLVMYLSY